MNSHDTYANAMATTASQRQRPHNTPNELASRMSRLIAHYIDFSIILLATYPVMSTYGTFSEMMADDFVFTTEMQVVNIIAGVLAYVIINGYFIHQYGQTVAKRILRIYIAKGDNDEKAGFVNILIIRNLLFKLIYLLPMVGTVIMLIDFLFIFGDDQRCLHDLVANTRVLKVSKN